MGDEADRLRTMQRRLDQVSPTFCLAKSAQSLLHLYNGQTYSCCKATPHGVPPHEILIDPSALHNTSQRKAQQRALRDGVKIDACNYCWDLEAISAAAPSERVVISAQDFAEPLFDVIAADPMKSVNPTFLEIAFSSTCNFKCSYCDPSKSTKWMEELRQYGPYPTIAIEGGQGVWNDSHSLEMLTQNRALPIAESQPNPFVDAFWRWWPELYPDLKILRVTGGEPLLSKDTLRLLDYVIEHPRPDLELSLNSNLGVPPRLIDAMVERVARITESRNVKKFVLYTSIDAWGAAAEYIRFGMQFERYWETVQSVLTRLPTIQLVFMSTMNLFSVFNYERLLEEILVLKRTFASGDRPDGQAIYLDVNYLVEPRHQTLRVLPPEFRLRVARFLDYMHAHPWTPTEQGFWEHETMKMSRLVAWLDEDVAEATLDQHRKELVAFFTEHDRRRGSDVLAIFPELKELWERYA